MIHDRYARPRRLTHHLGAALLVMFAPLAATATPTVVDWDALTWIPAGNGNLSETYPIGNGNFTVTVSGNTAELDQQGALIAPAITDQANTGGLDPAERSLYIATDYTSTVNPVVTVTFDFSGYPGGVGNVSFLVFDIDQGNGFIDQVIVTGMTASGPINPTTINTNVSNVQVNANTVQGIAGSPGTTSDGNAEFIFGDAGTPVSGITQVTFRYSNELVTPNPGFQWINIHDFNFDDPEADVSLVKSVVPASAGVGQNVTFTLDVDNAGPDAAPGVEVTDLLPAGISYVSDTGGGSYNAGTGIWDAGSVAASGTAQLTITGQVQANGGPWDNSAEVTALLATDPDSTPDNDMPAEDDQDNAQVLVPIIGTAKAVTAGPSSNGDGTFSLTYRVTLENFGNDVIDGVQVVDDLAATFAGASGFVVDSVTSADFTVNPGYDGSGDTDVLSGVDSLAVAATGTVDISLTVTPGASLGPYANTATGSGTSPGGAATSDDSADGADPDPDTDSNPGNNTVPTPVSFAEAPQIGTAKAVSAGPVNNGDGTYTLTYTLRVENSGDVQLSGLQVVDNLAATFAGATAFVVDSVTSADFTPNPGYDGSGDTNVLAGSDTLLATASGMVDVTVTVTPGGNLGPYDNSATVSATSPGGAGVADVSTVGTDPDPDSDGDPGNNSVPTPASFSETPQIGVAKAVSSGPVNNGDGTFTLTYRFTLENFGDVALNSVRVVDNLASTFSGATGFVVDSVTSTDFTPNAGFDGSGDTNVLAGSDTLVVAATGTVDVTVTVTPGGNLGPYDNSVFAQGVSPGGSNTFDTSVDGLDPDPDGNGDPVDNVAPTPVTFAETPQIGVAKAVSAGPANNGDGTFTLTYRFTLENFGDVALNSVQVVDNLASTFSGATGFVVDSVTSTDFTPNAGFDGSGDTNVLAGSDTLVVAATGTVDVTVTVTPGGNLGPYDNSVFAQGVSPGGSNTFDTSVDGLDPDPDGNGDPVDNVAPTPVTFAETPQIGVAKAVSAGPANNGDGTFTLTYRFTLENFGDVALNSVQVVDNLASTFSGATGFVVDSVTSTDFTPNAGFDGSGDTNVLAGSDTLVVAATGTVDVTVTVTPGGNLGPYDNSVFAQGVSPGGSNTFDTSVDGLDPDPDGNGDPVDNLGPTTVNFSETPQIGVAKALSSGPVNNGDGTFTLTYRFTLENFGDVPLNSLQVVDNLASTFSGATGFVVDSVTSADFTPNAGFDGSGDTNVLAGSDTLAVAASGTVDVTVTVTPGGNLGPYDNSVFAQGVSPGGSNTFDTSVDGLDPDPDADNDPVNNVGPTPVTFAEAPEIGMAKVVSAGPASNGDGTFTLTYTITLENSGDVPLNALQVVDNLATTFTGATGFVVDSVTSTDFTPNAGFDGTGDTDVLAGADSLAVGATGTVDVTVTVTPGANLGPYDNTATGAGTSPGTMVVTDDSTSGIDPDPDGDGDPGNDSVPTPVSFTETPEIGTAKAVSAGPASNGDGTFTLTYTITLENSGDVPLNALQVVDNLATTFTGATGFVVDSVTSTDFTPNPGFDGSGDTNVLAGADSLAVAATGTVDVTVTVTPGANLGPYDNTATGAGTSPGTMVVTDDSTSGIDPDPDGDGDPGNDSVPTPVSFTETPEIGTAKAVSAGPASNGDGTFTLTYTITLENSGDVPLNALQVVDNLATTFTGATGFVVDSVTSTDFTPNPGFDGSGDTNVLAGADSLAVAATGTVDVTVTVTPGANLGPYDNTATGAGTSPGTMVVTDDSTSGIDPDPDNDGDPGNDSVPTPVNFAEMPVLGVAKAVTTPVNNGDGTFTLTYSVFVENTGDVPLGSLQVTDDLVTTFGGAAGFIVDSVASSDLTVNSAFDGSGDTNLLAGSDTLAVSDSGGVAFTVTVTPGGNSGPYDNLATGSGLTPSATPVSDISTTGADPDPGNDGPGDDMIPTTVTFAVGVDASVDITDFSIPGETLDITVTDADLDTDPAVAEVIVVQVVNDTTGEIETVTLTETGPDTGIFAGTVDTVFGTAAGTDNDGAFNTEIGHTITVSYDDALTSTGGMATLTDTGVVGNSPPDAVDDSSATPIDTPVAIPVLVNDSDPNGHTLTVDSVTQPANGGVTFTPDGTVIYTPDPGFTGTDTFTYTISDGNGGLDTATVTVVVDNDTPTAVADSSVTPVDTPVVIAVLNNDSDPNNDTLTVVPGSITDPPNGSVVLNPDGTVTYTPDPGFTGTDTFTYTITDPDGNTDTALVTVVVSDDVPQATDDADTTPLDTPVTIPVLGNDSDPNNDPLEIVGLTQPANGTAVIDDNGTPADPTDDNIVYTPNAGFTGTDTFTYTITDPAGNADIATVVVTVVATASVEGNAWIDADVDDTFDANEEPLEGWMIDVLQNGMLVTTVPVAADGSYNVAGLTPGSGYVLQLRHPSSTAVFGVIESITLPPGTTVIDQNLPIDPSGVVYDADTRQPVAGAVVAMLGPSGGLPDACLLPSQQDQVTGADGYYRFDVLVDTDPACPSGATYTIVLTAPAGYVPGVSTLIPPEPVPLDATGQPDPFQVAPQVTAPTGADSTLYYLAFELAAGDPDVINNHIPLDPVAAVAALRVSKRADRRTTVVGDLLVYEITVTNDSAGVVTGLTLSDLLPAGFSYVTDSARAVPSAGSTLTVSGQRPVEFAGIRVGANSSTTLRYVAQVGAGVLRGDQINTVTPILGGVPAGNTATATVTITADPDFEETTIAGTVFGDANGNGRQDPGEAGIPGVRLGTVEGLLIETDAFGRYHIAGVDGGFRERGRNFIIKVDTASLPDGAEFTTENPRVQRITQGLMSQIDFGVRMPAGAAGAGCCRQIDVKVAEVFFADGSAEVRPEFMPLLRELAQRLRDHGGGTLYVQGHASAGETLPAERRAYTITPRFGVRSAQLQPDDRAELDRIIEQWRGARNLLIEAVGHTDNTPIAPRHRDEFADNQALSAARAQAVATYVRLALKAAPEQVSVSGRGADEPVAGNDTAAGRAANRRVELSISGDWSAEAADAGQLARQRAQRVYELLKGMLGEDLMREVDVRTRTVPPAQAQPVGATGKFWRRGAAMLLGMLFNTAHAADLQCTLDDCRTESGYVIEIIEPDAGREPSPDDTRAALANDSRVDVSGSFMVPVAGGGQLWVTEDPKGAEPRLAVHAPEVGAAENGRLAVPLSFYVYTNYAGFIARAEIQIYHGDDIDLIEPLAVVAFRPGVFSRIDWRGDGLSRPVAPGDELYFRVRAYDDKGRYDETHLSHVTLLSREDYERVAEREPGKLLPAVGAVGATAARGPLDGAVLVLSPPAERIERERESYTLTPHFDTRKAVLEANDRADLERIVDDWRDTAADVRIHVIGHTDSRPIAPRNRHEFADNRALSEARARAVVEYLARGLNLDRSHFVSEGRAAREPVATNATEAGRAENRRVEVTINGVREIRRVLTPARAGLTEPASNTTVVVSNTLEEAANLLDARLQSGEMDAPAGRRYADPAAAQASEHILAAVYGQNNLRVQRIPVNGSRVRVNGHNLGASGLVVNGEAIPLDSSGRYAIEYLMPVGRHDFDVEVLDAGGAVTDRARLPVEVTGQQIFLVALADLTLSDSSVSGNIEQLAADDRYDGDFLVEGRLAFYLKGKIRGKYLVTAQLDSREEQLDDLFGNLFDKDPQSVFRRLDPDRYYPVYGDDSTTINDIDTQGRFYVRADWDRSSATWGNFHTGLTGNEFAQYNRSLYGARYRHESLNVTGEGKARNEGTLFVSEAQTAFGHSEFIGTGGSLYYLKHQDILPGSEKAWIEVRDRDSARVRDTITLVRGIDYEVDEIQGRIILARPLMQVTLLQSPGLIKDEPLDGNDMVLLVDYEFLPAGFSPDKVTAGGRGEHWLTDDIKIGATYVDENRAGDDYSLAGGDVLFQPGEGTHVKLEYARSESSQAARFLSLDGGLSFVSQGTPAPGRDGSAWGIEARLNSREAFDTEHEWVGGVWYRDTDAGFSVARRDLGVDTKEFGLEMTGALSDRWQLSARFSKVERGALDEDQRLSLQADYALGESSTLSGEVRSVDERTLVSDARGTLLALRYSYELTTAVEVYGVGQFTLSNDDGRYDNNDLATIGASVQVGDRTSVIGEYSTGHRGDGALLTLDHKLNDRHQVYGTFTQSVDRTDLRNPGTQLAFGHRSRITDQATLYNERQFVEDRGSAGIAHVFGLDFEPKPGWGLGLSVQNGDLQNELGTIDRDTATVTADFRGDTVKWRGKVEYREEKGLSDLRQVLTTNRVDFRLSDNWRMLARLNHAETEDRTLVGRDDSALFTEAGMGFAYRPVDGGKLNLLAKYTFLYDLPAPLQIDGGTDQRSHILSVEGIYRLTPKWELGGKVAQRDGELRIDRDFGEWFESSTTFLALRGRYHLVRRWDAMIELRSLDVDEAESTRTGWLVAIDRHFNDHLRLGLGYNFTDFSDDLGDLDYDHKGWFLNAIGKY